MVGCAPASEAIPPLVAQVPPSAEASAICVRAKADGTFPVHPTGTTNGMPVGNVHVGSNEPTGSLGGGYEQTTGDVVLQEHGVHPRPSSTLR